ncbi:PREDICTED: chromosome-associated kinesin KIF4A-like isoform X3 [Camelina sativa]|uniref:Chromosome-associated kinesin KIF4A-like isoform X3 n=1 Tax=Camelina sativa TaxID=90675 RepID=A0ABM0YAY1_CAMSA|nr:PREDICTED: chromosome-associated kinesin KIF4A-like isoform X3 [Camelina sativa]
MTDPEQKLTALKKAYADTILNTAKEAAARVMISEKKARGFQQELAAVRDEALRTCLRLKQMYDSKVKEAEIISLKKQQKIEELEAQLGEAEDIVGELRTELRESRSLLEKLINDRQTNLSNEGKNANEAVSIEVREDSSNHERSVVANGIKPHMSDRDAEKLRRWKRKRPVGTVLMWDHLQKQGRKKRKRLILSFVLHLCRLLRNRVSNSHIRGSVTWMEETAAAAALKEEVPHHKMMMTMRSETGDKRLVRKATFTWILSPVQNQLVIVDVLLRSLVSFYHSRRRTCCSRVSVMMFLD